MMDERIREMIEAYLPNPPDPELEEGEYYYLQSTNGRERVIRVFPLDILPHHDGTEYGIYQKKGGNLVWVDVGYGDRSRGTRFGNLYDNKEDCRHSTHYFLDNWEWLRKEQREG